MRKKEQRKLDWLNKPYLPLAGLLLVWVGLCWPMMSGQSVVGFRDSAYLYYPLFAWIDAQWEAGEIPLWNPFCNFGMPLVGDATPSVFYPGKLIFFFRFLSFPARYGVYLSIHILLAGVGTYWLARILKANPAGAALAAISYALGGGVLFQVTNVIYLVSAAWLPVALGCVWQMLRCGERRWAVGAGVCCAMMILGGDPQMVYHVGLIAAASFVSRRLRAWRRNRNLVAASQKTIKNHNVSPKLSGAALATGSETLLKQNRRLAPCRSFFPANLLLMVGVTVLLSLVQLLPSHEWSQLSERTNSDIAVNVFHAVGKDFQTARRSLLGPPEPGTIVHHAYQFSLPPWSLAELFWPNFSGRIYPAHQRWADVFPGADRVWFPSLYIGLLTVWLAIVGMKFSGCGRSAWLTRICLFFGVASFGWYGVVWLVNELLPEGLRAEALGPQVGGVYWAMVTLLPKYYSFRYPAKLFLIASLCLCLLAGVQLRRWRLKFSPTWIGFFLLISIGGCGALALGLHQGFFERVPDDGLFGPFDQSGATRSLIFGFVQSLAVLGLAVWVSKSGRLKQQKNNLILWGIVLITTIDLVMANRWLLADVPKSALTATNEPMKWMDQQFTHRGGVGPIAGGIKETPPTIYRPRGAAFLPPKWLDTGSPKRLEEIITWQRETLYPKQHLGRQVRLVGSFSSIWPEQYERLLSEIEDHDHPLIAFCDAELVEDRSTDETQVGVDWFTPQPRWVFLIDDSFPPKAVSVHEVESKIGPESDLKPTISTESNCEITRFSLNSLSIEVTTEKQRWVVCNTLFDGNWRAKIKDVATGEERTQPLVELADCYQGVLVEAGGYELEFFYFPVRFWIGAWVSGCGWLVLVAGWVVEGFRRR